MVHGNLLPRKAAWFVKPGCKCYYKYSDTKWPPNEMPDWFNKIQISVMKRLGIPLKCGPNSCNVNLYYSGTASVGWHSDDEPIFQSKVRDCLIVSLSLGVSRKFEFKRQGAEQLAGHVWVKDGDLMTMEGLFQKHFLHRIPKQPRCKGKRINFTWRWVTLHDKKTCNKKFVWSLGHLLGVGKFPEWHPRHPSNRGRRRRRPAKRKRSDSVDSVRSNVSVVSNASNASQMSVRSNKSFRGNPKKPRHNASGPRKGHNKSSFFLGGSR